MKRKQKLYFLLLRYIPPLAESQLNPAEVSFCRDPRRSQLFAGKTFIFLSPKQVSHFLWRTVNHFLKSLKI